MIQNSSSFILFFRRLPVEKLVGCFFRRTARRRISLVLRSNVTKSEFSPQLDDQRAEWQWAEKRKLFDRYRSWGRNPNERSKLQWSLLLRLWSERCVGLGTFMINVYFWIKEPSRCTIRKSEKHCKIKRTVPKIFLSQGKYCLKYSLRLPTVTKF